MKQSFFCLIGIFSFISCFSQSHNKIWYFGDHAGIDFNTNPPTPLNNSVMYQPEGCATVCDVNGQLLFYSNGVRVWNRNHQVMQNGDSLLGGMSSTQSVLIIPKPFNDNICYVFTVPQEGIGTGALRYSIVDMTMAGGLGAVTVKNFMLHGPVGEKLTATLKSNGADYWVIVKELATDAFFVYSLTSTGVDISPVISHSGFVIGNYGIGYARVSPNGSKLCLADWEDVKCQLFDFNNNTGIVSNAMNIPNIGNQYGYIYGVEFSADNSKLYTMKQQSYIIYQYDLLAGTPADIINSAVEIAHTPAPNLYGGAMILGPDNKIYISDAASEYVSVIDQPNLPGAASNYIFRAIHLSPGTFCALGLPNTIIAPLSQPCPPVQNYGNNINICSNQIYQLPSGTTVSVSGIYLDTLRNQAATCDSIVYTINLSVYEVSLLNTEAHICSDQNFQLLSGMMVNTEGIYTDTLRNIVGCDSIINTIHLIVNDLSYTNQFDSIYAGQTYILPSGQTVNAAGVYQTVLMNSLGCDSIITTTLTLKEPFAECITYTNAITPNGDGINDYWVLYKYNCFKKLEVNVYNRNGSLVYHADDYKNDWNGKYKNKELPDGTYYYVVKVISFDGKEHVFRDNVTILR